MNLKKCLLDVEQGLAGEEHAAVLRDALDWDKNLTGKALARVARMDELLAEARRWARHFWRQRNHSRNMAAMYKTSYAELLHAWQTRERCQTCRYYEDNGRERWCGLDSNTCAPNDFGGWEAKDDGR